MTLERGIRIVMFGRSRAEENVFAKEDARVRVICARENAACTMAMRCQPVAKVAARKTSSSAACLNCGMIGCRRYISFGVGSDYRPRDTNVSCALNSFSMSSSF